MMNEGSLKDAALEYASMGWSVLPLQERAKIPATTSGLKDATTDAEQIAAWWDYYPRSNIAIALGTASGNMIAIDIDVDEEKNEDGWASLAEWEQEHDKLPETASDISGRGGGRLYYIVDRPISNSTNAELGIDVRGEGGYCVMPPSVHPNGNVYTWECPPDETPPAMANDLVYEFMAYVQRGAGASTGAHGAKKPRFELPTTRIPKGERNTVLFKYTCQMQERGDDDALITVTVKGINQSLCDPPLDDSEVDAIIKSALGRYSKGNGEKRRRKPKKADEKSLEAVTQPPIIEAVEPSLVVFPYMAANGKPMNRVSNYKAILEYDDALAGHIRYNMLDHSVYIVGGAPWTTPHETRRIDDSDYANLRIYCEKYGLSSTVNMIDAVLSISKQRMFNPVVDWLNSLPPWDGIPRISTLLHDFLGAKQSPLTDWTMHLFMWGCVARGLEPGCKFDFMPILVGEQGVGKSLFIRRLAVLSDWFDDSFTVVLGDVAIERMNGLWIAEIPELSSLKRTKDNEQIKAFLTTATDSIRPKYARTVERWPRICCFFGTTNQREFLTDKTGNRRFIPIDLFGAEAPAYDLRNEEFCLDHFQQCWAEALKEWRTKQSPCPGGYHKVSLEMPSDMAEIIQEARSEHSEDSPAEGMITSFLENVPLSRKYICAVMIACEVLGYERHSIPQWVINDIRDAIQSGGKWVPCGKKSVPDYGVQRCFTRVE